MLQLGFEESLASVRVSLFAVVHQNGSFALETLQLEFDKFVFMFEMRNWLLTWVFLFELDGFVAELL